MYFLNIIEKTEKNNKIGNFNISKSTGDLDSQTPSEKASETEMKKLPESGKCPSGRSLSMVPTSAALPHYRKRTEVLGT